MGLEGIELILRAGAADDSVPSLGQFQGKGSSQSFAHSRYHHFLSTATGARRRRRSRSVSCPYWRGHHLLLHI
uniref:NADPH-dependent pterin aldehyde reductase isoform X1 n=1 Tax=Rhizophora mucronata TaxID=61149 RepID=A0A2P2K8I6_RHIMU